MGAWQVCPHPFEQHFSEPGQLASDSHSSTQIPAPLGGGQAPGFPQVVLPIDGYTIGITTNTRAINIFPINARFIVYSP
jgi:hypothetical protein